MKYWPAMLVLFLAVLLGGCQEDKKQHVKPSEINVENLPDVRAFQALVGLLARNHTQ
ncbi:hypothetical protein [Virgibacillus halodenitrificans]|uniref:hypothetical protein n=1 Tax=Virgibacillus halodenitrificans TaxID=1482 RepID=UPI00136F5760|nr:hypothetical protein [Virgibacillus halodenitrificans]MYL58037.1 hypothetical protein [Virgibacillus halodenitrificans]